MPQVLEIQEGSVSGVGTVVLGKPAAGEETEAQEVKTHDQAHTAQRQQLGLESTVQSELWSGKEGRSSIYLN